MPPPTLAPTNPADELFPDAFQKEALDLVPTDALTRPRCFEPVALAVVMRNAYVNAGLVPPLELIIATPSGAHERRELAVIPLAIVFTPNEGGIHRITLREQAHMQWWGGVNVGVDGEKARAS